MFCIHCGKQIEDGSMFCLYCGQKVTHTDDADNKSTNEVTIRKDLHRDKDTKPSDYNEQGAIIQSEKYPTEKSKPKQQQIEQPDKYDGIIEELRKSKSTCLLLIIAGVVIIFILIGVFAYRTLQKAADRSPHVLTVGETVSFQSTEVTVKLVGAGVADINYDSLLVQLLTPARQRGESNMQPRHAPTRSAQNGKRPTGNTARGTVSNGRRRIKEVQSGAKAVGRTSRKAVKGAESSGKAIKAGGRSVQTVRQTAQATVQIRQRAVQAANAAQRMAKTATAALRGAVAAVRSLAPLLAAGGGTVFAVMLVLCMAGAILASPLGIFFSLFGGNSGGGQQQATVTMSAVIQKLNQEYDARLDEIRANASYDEESLIGSHAPWPEVLAVYAVKTATDPANEQGVVTMTDEKKALLKQVFWDMNELSSFTSTVPGEEADEEDTTTLYITVTAKTASEMVDIYNFNDDQCQQLVELLSRVCPHKARCDKMREWN